MGRTEELSRNVQLLTRYRAVLEQAARPASVLSPGRVAFNRFLLFGLPIGGAIAAYLATDSWLWTIAALIACLVAGFMLAAMGSPSTGIGTRGFEVEQEIALAIRFLREHVHREPNGLDDDALTKNNDAIEHYIGEIEARLPHRTSSEPGKNTISVTRAPG